MATAVAPIAHKQDAAWIIALWKAIHGGDPPVEQIAAQAISALTAYLNTGELTHVEDKQAAERLSAFGLTVTDYQTRSEAPRDAIVLPTVGTSPGNQTGPLRCYKNAKGQTICVPVGGKTAAGG